MHRFSVRSLAIVPLALAALATGCGGSSSSSSSGSASAADAVPAGALFYADVNLDHGSSAWQQFATVGKRFPGWQRLVDNAVKSFDDNSTGTSYKDDIEPWLGDTAGVAVTSVDLAGATPNWVVFVASKDDGKAKDAISGGHTHADGEYNGYSQYTSTTSDGELGVGDGAVIIASTTQTLHDAIDVRDGKAGSLADEQQFTDAMSRLPADSLVRGYANPSKLAELLSLAQLSGQAGAAGTQQLQGLTKSLDWLDSASFAMLANAGGYSTVFHVHVKDGADPGLYGSQATGDSTLTPLVPADAFLFLSASLPGDTFTKAFTQGFNSSGGQLSQLEQITGLSVANDIAPLFSGELLLYAAPGLPARGALLLKPNDPDAAALGLRHIMQFAARTQPQLRIRDLPGGREGQSLELSPGFTFTWERKPGGLIAIGNDTAAGSDPGQGLLESPDYTSLVDKADLPAGARVAGYLSIPGILKLVPTEIDPNLSHLGGVLDWGARDGNEITFGIYVEVK